MEKTRFFLEIPHPALDYLKPYCLHHINTHKWNKIIVYWYSLKSLTVCVIAPHPVGDCCIKKGHRGVFIWSLMVSSLEIWDCLHYNTDYVFTGPLRVSSGEHRWGHHWKLAVSLLNTVGFLYFNWITENDNTRTLMVFSLKTCSALTWASIVNTDGILTGTLGCPVWGAEDVPLGCRWGSSLKPGNVFT